MLALLALLASGAGPDVLPPSALEITFEADPSSEVRGAMDQLRAGAFEEAARRLAAVAEAGGGADVRYLEAVGWYEAGQLARADGATVAGLALAQQHAPLLSLRGLVLADLGRGDDALAALDAADRSATEPSVRARIGLNRAVVHLDTGDLPAAEAALTKARPEAERAQDADLLARIEASGRQVAALRGEPGAADPIGRVTELLAKGDVAGAKAGVPEPVPGDRRGQLRAAIALGAIARAEGRLEDARKGLEAAVAQATAAGLLRERAAANAQLGVLYVASNRPEVARARLEEAVELLDGTSLRVLLLSVRLEAARAAVRAGDTGAAAAHLSAARTLSATTGDAGAALALLEVEGMLAAANGDAAASAASYAKAIAGLEARGAWADVARVGCAAVRLGGDALARDRERTLAAFQQAGDPLGPAHVGIALGLGRADRDDLEGAVAAFVAAAQAAEKVGGERGKQVALVAREDAAQALADLSDSAAVLEQAEQWGLEDLVARATTFRRAKEAYDDALADYEAGRWDDAHDGFDAAVRGLESIGELAYARVARRGRAWARFNSYTRADATSGFPVWQGLVEEGMLLQDAELRVRSMVAVALAAGELKRPEASRSLVAAAAEAEAMGLRGPAGQCHAAIVDVLPAIEDKVLAARRAFVLRDGDKVGVHAMYSAAVALYEAEAYDRAEALAAEVLPVAGELAPAVREVLEAAKQAR